MGMLAVGNRNVGQVVLELVTLYRPVLQTFTYVQRFLQGIDEFVFTLSKFRCLPRRQEFACTGQENRGAGRRPKSNLIQPPLKACLPIGACLSFNPRH